MRRRFKITICGAFLLALFVYLNNTSRFSRQRTGSPHVLAHRGMAQRFNLTNLTADTCTASRMLVPEHAYLENTISSMRAAFDRGADVVEFDINATRDGQFAVFHDRALDCRTNGHGLVREHTVDDLRRLDVGYGYTADRGRSYPFRGTGVGLMPLLDEVLDAFPNRAFLIDIKGNNPRDGTLLATYLSKRTPERRSQLMVFGLDTTLAALHETLADMRVFSAASITNCLIRYIAYGWTGIVPGACANSTVFVPINVMPWLWGWPNRFMDRIEGRGSSVVVMGVLSGADFPAGVDTVEQLERLPRDYNGGIWTNNVELVKQSAP